MRRNDLRNVILGLGITSLLLAGLILLPGVVLASGDYQAAGTVTPTASATAGLPATGGGTYIVQPIDTLSSIALSHGVTVMSIVNANPQIVDPNVIANGEQLNIPAPNLKPGESIWDGYDFTKYPSVAAFLAGLPATGATATATPGIPATGPSSYIVSPFDTLSSIALAHGVTVVSIMQANPEIGNPNIVYPGQQITIPAPNLRANESIWNGYDFTKYPSVAAALALPATGATATPAAPGAATETPVAVTPTAQSSPTATTPATPTATPAP